MTAQHSHKHTPSAPASWEGHFAFTLALTKCNAPHLDAGFEAKPVQPRLGEAPLQALSQRPVPDVRRLHQRLLPQARPPLLDGHLRPSHTVRAAC